MRITAGIHKGRKLASLPGITTRPTSGKVREAIFNICRPVVTDANVLDLFAGTGAFGLEALSRGAAKAVFVDSDRRCVETIRKNIAACRETDRATVIRADITVNLNMLPASGIDFDLVFMDPPYHGQAVSPALDNLAAAETLAPGAIVIIEHDQYENIPEEKAGLKIIDRRKYGKTLVTLLKWL
ncbi:MAG: 16S rRNA (guanine(966)-N(2))-methyltransferase RsmD [Desulfosalsimonadaceae bacterium]